MSKEKKRRTIGPVFFGYLILMVSCILACLFLGLCVILGIENKALSQQHETSMDRIAVIEEELIQINATMKEQE